MINLSNEEILKHIDSKYSFVTVVSKRARQILEGSEPLVKRKEKDERVLSIALRELSEDKIKFHRINKENLEEKEDINIEEESSKNDI